MTLKITGMKVQLLVKISKSSQSHYKIDTRIDSNGDDIMKYGELSIAMKQKTGGK